AASDLFALCRSRDWRFAACHENATSRRESGEDVVDRGGLGDVNVEAGLLRATTVLGLTVAGERDDAEGRSQLGAQLARDGEAGDPRQAEVDDGDVRPVRDRTLDALGTVGDPVASELEARFSMSRASALSSMSRMRRRRCRPSSAHKM